MVALGAFFLEQPINGKRFALDDAIIREHKLLCIEIYIINQSTRTTMAYRSALLLSFLHATCNVNFAAADFSAILTETIFNQLAPNAVPLYSYNGFVTAVNWWNTNFPGNPVFSGSETQQRDELAVSHTTPINVY